MVNEGLYPSEPNECGFTPVESVVWLSPRTFVAKGFFLKDLEGYSKGEVNSAPFHLCRHGPPPHLRAP